jgi:ribosomal protein S18 acetylase RimI-like enzyme
VFQFFVRIRYIENIQLEPLPQQYELRPATEDDAKLMFRLQKLDGAYLDQDDVEQAAKFEEYKKDFNPDEIQVVCLFSEPIGRLRIVRGSEIYIGGMQILPEYRGRGFGTAILESLIEESRQTAKPIRLEVFHNNLPAFRLYQKVGFKVVEENDQQKIMVYEP